MLRAPVRHTSVRTALPPIFCGHIDRVVERHGSPWRSWKAV